MSLGAARGGQPAIAKPKSLFAAQHIPSRGRCQQKVRVSEARKAIEHPCGPQGH